MEPQFKKVKATDFITADNGKEVSVKLEMEFYTDGNEERIVSCVATLLEDAKISDSSFHDEVVKMVTETKGADKVYFECEIKLVRFEYSGPMHVTE